MRPLRIPVLSIVAAGFAVLSALITVALFFLAVEEALVGPLSGGLVIGFLTSFLATFGFLATAAIAARRRLALPGWRRGWDADFAGVAVASAVGAVGTGLAVGFDLGGSAMEPIFWVLVIVLFVTLVRWTWSIWRAIESAN